MNLSVLIKTYNCEKYLFEILEALAEADEIVILDFHSTDETVAVAKEYKTKVIFSDKNEKTDFKEIIENLKNDWVLILEENEIVPKKLLDKINQLIANPPKNKNIFSFPRKYFYLNKEIKFLKEKNQIRLFRKNFCVIKENFSISPNGKYKIQKVNENFKKKNEYILKFIDNNISLNIENMLEKNKAVLKTTPIKSPSVIAKPLISFLYWYILKRGFLEGEFGYLFSKMKFIEEFILQIMILEKNFKGEKYDI